MPSSNRTESMLGMHIKALNCALGVIMYAVGQDREDLLGPT